LEKVGSVPVNTEFISKDNTFITSYTEGIPVKEPLGISRLVKGVFKTIGLTESDKIVDVVISQNFANSVFDLNVINIEIRQPYAVVKSGVIEATVILRGMRWFMQKWFWTCLCFSVSTLTSTFVIFLNILWRCCSSAKNKIRPKRQNIKRESDEDDGSEEELAQDTIYENRKKQEAVVVEQKKTMDTFLRKFD